MSQVPSSSWAATILFFSAAPMATASSSPSKSRASMRPEILAGRSATDGQLGFMAYIQASTSTGSSDCSGTVVAPTLVLTAAHCVFAASTGALNAPRSYVVVTGSADLTDADMIEVSAVSRIIPDPQYNSTTHSADAALLVLSTPTTASSISLATTGTPSAGTQAIVAGWGLTSTTTQTSPHVVQYAQTVVQSPAFCAQYSPDYDALQLCAMDYPARLSSICFGDSGGPLLVTYRGSLVEAAINDYVLSTTCAPALPQYFTAIAPQEAWIARQIKAYSKPSPVPSISITPATPAAESKAPTRTRTTAQPRLTLAQASSATSQVLTHIYGPAFTHKTDYTLSCSRISASRDRCHASVAATVSHHSYDYSGSVIVSRTSVSKTSASLTDTYAIHRVDESCRAHSPHPGNCAVQTRRGTWR